MFNNEKLQRGDGSNVPNERVFFRVLDLRVRRQLLNGEHMRPYCVLRLGELHHRTCSFSPEGLHQVSARRTTTDDREPRGELLILLPYYCNMDAMPLLIVEKLCIIEASFIESSTH